MIPLLILSLAAASPKADARRAFEEGTEALSTGRFADAVSDFERCLNLAKRPPCAFNLAVAHRGTGDVLAAEQVLMGLLTGTWGRLAKTRRRQVTALLQETRKQVATLEVRLTAEAGPTVRLDGELVAANEKLRVNPGERAVLVTADRFQSIERTVTLKPGKQEVISLELIPIPGANLGTLIVETSSATDRIEVEGIGVSVGSYNQALEPGTYRLRVSGDGELREQSIEIEPGATLRMSVDLREKASVLSSPWFWVGTALVAAGSVGAVLLLTQDEAPPLVEDDRFGVTEALRR
ncbi:MAG: hypothetical protein AAF654_06450 [Myxococcota bacterium]